MREVTEKQASFAYLDTYAHLLDKLGDERMTKTVAKRAIEAGIKSNENVKPLEKMIKEL